METYIKENKQTDFMLHQGKEIKLPREERVFPIHSEHTGFVECISNKS